MLSAAIGISSECKRGRLMRGNFIARLCKSSSLAAQCPMCWIYDRLYQHLWSEYGSSFYFLLCVSLSQDLYISFKSGTIHTNPSWARSNNLRCLLMINDPSRSARMLGLCHAIKGKQTSSNVLTFSLFFTGISHISRHRPETFFQPTLINSCRELKLLAKRNPSIH